MRTTGAGISQVAIQHSAGLFIRYVSLKSSDVASAVVQVSRNRNVDGKWYLCIDP